MIPKTIHYCWFGHSPLPGEVLDCIKSWYKFCPDYEIKQWDESNFDVGLHPYVKEAYEAKKWAFVTDFARLWILEREGGIYLDTDVELVSTLDSLFQHSCTFGEEIHGRINTGIGFATEAHHPAIQAMLSQYDNVHFSQGDDIFDMTPCPIRNTAALVSLGYRKQAGLIPNIDCMVFPPEYMSPINPETGEKTITARTLSIHHFSGSWKSDEEKRNYRLKKKLQKIFGRLGNFMYAIYAVMFQLKHKGVIFTWMQINHKIHHGEF